MVVQGNAQVPRTNDVWASGDLGVSWYLIAGATTNVSAAGDRANSSFTEVFSRPATGIDQHNRIYRVGGEDARGNLHNSVWLTSDGGLTWFNQATSQNAEPFTPGRSRSSLSFDEDDTAYLVGGEIRVSDHLMTSSAFKSDSEGISWTALPPTPWTPRGTGILLTQQSAQLQGASILTYFTGWGGQLNRVYNEVWVSSDHATTWVQVRTNWNNGLAPFRARDAANAEVTQAGVMVLLGGQSNGELLNDVWISMDGGFSWGKCVENATFDDRREPLTMLDNKGYLYVAGGLSNVRGSLNDGQSLTPHSTMAIVFHLNITHPLPDVPLFSACAVQCGVRPFRSTI